MVGSLVDGGQVRFDAQRRNELTHPTFNIKINLKIKSLCFLSCT